MLSRMPLQMLIFLEWMPRATLAKSLTGDLMTRAW